MEELNNNNNNNNNNDGFITVFPLKGGSSSVKYATILKNKIITIVILIIYNIKDATTKVNNQEYRQIKKSNVHMSYLSDTSSLEF